MATRRAVTAFRVDVPDAVIDDLHRRLDATIWPPVVEGADWSDGADRATVEALCAAWRHDFDWRAIEARINGFNQVLVTHGTDTVHCVHEPGKGPNPLPLVITHGWPSSFVEFLDVIGPLTDPAAHGGDERDSFSVVVPSLPGYGWSSPPTTPGCGIPTIAQRWLHVMRELGYERFGAHGGDWGSGVTVELGRADPTRVVGMHVIHPPAPPGLDLDLSPEAAERVAAWRARVDAYGAKERGYIAIQSTKPQTAAFGLTDSPAGLLAWIIEKWWRWSDIEDAQGHRDLSRAYSTDDLLANVMVYWATRSIGPSMHLYFETFSRQAASTTRSVTDVPFGVAAFNEVIRPPRELVEPHYDLRRWTEIDRGGHFPALENPAALVDEIRAFFRPLRDERA